MADDVSDATGERWDLRLYVADRTPSSVRAIENLEAICKESLEGRFTLEIIDLLEHPELAAEHQILALPTLVRRLPEPVRKIIGDLSKEENVLVGLDLKAA